MTAFMARHPFLASLGAMVVAAAVTLGIAQLAGLHQVGRAFDHLRPGWLVVAVLVQAVSVTAYVAVYEAVVSQTTGRRPARRLTTELVLAGFGPFALAGGFELDHRWLRRLGLEERVSLRTVLDLSGLELLSLVWIAFAVAIAALIADPSLPQSLIWPWLIAVPLGTALAAVIARRTRYGETARDRMFLGELVGGLADVLGFARHPVRARAAWGGVVVFWAADMATLYAALRTFGVRAPIATVVLAYATGYLVSRRTLPLGGAGFIQALITFSLYWAHEPLAASLAAVIVYRGVTMVLALAPALAARLRLEAIEELAHPLGAPEAERGAQRSDA